MSEPRVVNLIGGRGYTGSALLALIATHPGMVLGVASSRSDAGVKISDSCEGWPDDGRVFTRLEPGTVNDHPADAWVLALPNGLSAPWVSSIGSAFPEALILDLGADYRFDKDWTYGLPERFRSALKDTKRIANPGCYATGSQLGLLPLNDQLSSAPVIFGVSGFSGAGKTPSPRNDPTRLKDNLIPYALSGHVHEKEISYQLENDIRFVPHVASFFRGISLTIAAQLTAAVTVDGIEDRFNAYYRAEALVSVSRDVPEVSAIQGSPNVRIGGFTVDERDATRVTFVVVLDNLLKGAASQAMQNLNLALGLEELAGIHR